MDCFNRMEVDKMKKRISNLCFSVLVALPVMQSTVVMAFPGQAIFNKLISNFTTAAFAGAGLYSAYQIRSSYFYKKYQNENFTTETSKVEIADNLFKVALPCIGMFLSLSDSKRGSTIGMLMNAIAYCMPREVKSYRTVFSAALLAGAYYMPDSMHSAKFNGAVHLLLKIARDGKLDKVWNIPKHILCAGIVCCAYFGSSCNKDVSGALKPFLSISKFVFG